MISEEQIDKLTELLIQRIQLANEYFLKNIGNSIAQIKKLSSSQAHKLVQMLKYGDNYKRIVKEISKYTDMDIKDIDSIFESFAKQDQKFYEKFYKYRNIPFVPYEENVVLRNQTRALANIVKNEMYDYFRSKVLGYAIRDNKNKLIFRGLKETYNYVLDEALLNVSQGIDTYDDAMKRILSDLGGSGLKTIEYASGRAIRLDSVVRMHLDARLSELHNENQKIYGEEFDADGYEISVHANPAIDHEPVQGRQFSFEEYKKLNGGLLAKDYKGRVYTLDHDGKNGYRPISELNCKHYIFAIVLGVSEPSYSDKELKQIIDKNEKGFELDGKHYSMYEGTQLQRQLEREIRKQKDIQILAKESDNKELILESQSNITKLTNKYNELSKVSGLPTKAERLKVSGYKRVKVDIPKEEISMPNNNVFAPLEKYQDIISKANGNINDIDDNIFKDMLSDYNKWYDTLDKNEIAKVLDDYNEHVQKTNNININNISIKESNPLGEFLNKKLGYDAKPELIDKKEFWIDEDGEQTNIGDTTLLDKNHWYRGIDGEKAKEYINEFKTGDLFAGEGYDANGTFVSNSYQEAFSYSGQNEENIIYIIPKDNAKIIRFNQISGLGYKITSQINYNDYMNEAGELYINFADKVLYDNGYLSSLLGYDIIDFEPIDARKVILNRGSIKVVK